MLEPFQSDLGFIEGPVVLRDGSVVVTSIDRGLLYRVTETGKEVVARTGGGPNGATEGADGLYVAQNGGCWPALNEIRAEAGIQRIAPDGTVTTVMTGPTAPNDLAFGPDGLLYVTDPTRKPERDDGRIWRVDPKTGRSEMILSLGWYPNGIGFSSESDCFYVADTGNRRIVRFPLTDPRPESGETVLTMTEGMPDGFAFDTDGTMLIAAPGFREDEPGTLQVWSGSGRHLDTIRIDGSRFVTNVALTGDGRVFVCESGRGTLLTGRHGVPGLSLHPFR